MSSDEKAGSKRRRSRFLAGISTNVLVLGVVSFLTDTSSEMLYPILPMFLVSIGATGAIIGLIEGASETTASLLKVYSGWTSDKRRRRKPFVLGGYGLSSLTKPFFMIATAPWHVLGIRVTERVGKGIRSAPRDALIADSVDAGVRGKAFGLHKMFDSLGAVAGPLIALAVIVLTAASLDALDDVTYRTIFLAATIPAFAAVAVIVLFLREKEGGGVKVKGRFLAEARRLERPFWILMVVVLAFYIGEVSYAFFILRGQEVGLSVVTVLLLYTMFNLVFALTAMPAGVLSDRIGRKPVILLSFAVFALACGVMGAAGSVLPVVAGFALFGLYKGGSEGVLKAYVVDFIPKELRGTALGVFHTAVGMVMLPGGIIAGLLWDSVGPWATFSFGGAMALVAAGLLMVLGGERPRPTA
jgi:MFS family permease